MRLEKKRKNKFLYKKLTRLKLNPLNNNKFLKLVLNIKIKKRYKIIKGKLIETEVFIKRFEQIAKRKKKKWSTFLNLLVKANKFFKRYKPYTTQHYSVSKFASSGNSYQKQFKKDFLTKKMFNYFYGGLKQKPLKKKMSEIFKLKKIKNNFRNFCIEIFESRLDAVLRKAYFCSTIKEAKQIVAQKHVLINGKIESNYSYILKLGDLIQIKSKIQKTIKTQIKKKFKKSFNRIIWPVPSSYLIINYNLLEIIFGNTYKFKFSSSFIFRNDTERVVEHYYRH